MATAGGGRRLRLSEVLREQQEPFLLPLHRGGRGSAPCCSSVNDKGVAGASWGRAVRRALPGWRLDRLSLAAGCFPCAASKRESFRRLPPAKHARCHDDDDVAAKESDGGDARRLSPVSVLDVLRCSDEEDESPSSSPPPTLRDWEEEEDDDKPSWSTPGSSPAAPDTPTGGKKSEEEEDWRKVVSSWERIAGDIARVPAMVGLDLLLSASAASTAREWHGELAAEAERVGASVEAMIFSEMSAEAVRDMVEL